MATLPRGVDPAVSMDLRAYRLDVLPLPLPDTAARGGGNGTQARQEPHRH